MQRVASLKSNRCKLVKGWTDRKQSNSMQHTAICCQCMDKVWQKTVHNSSLHWFFFRINMNEKMAGKYNVLFSLSLKIHSYKGMWFCLFQEKWPSRKHPHPQSSSWLLSSSVQSSLGVWHGHGPRLAAGWESVSWLWYQISMAWRLSISSWCSRVTKHTGAGKTTSRLLLHWR